MACKKPYSPPATSVPNQFLVVEGVINGSNDSTIIKLSRTVNINSISNINPVLKANVVVQNDQNTSFTLKEIGNGLYGIASINLDNARKYRVYIKTIEGGEYASDLVTVKNSPPIDSIVNEFTATSENFYSYTHDPANNTHYYRWDYSETYLYNAPIKSDFIFKINAVVYRTPDEQIYTCYISNTSSTIILNSSTKLTQDVIYKNPITQVSFTLDKLKIRYSLLVKQYALTTEAYNYYTNLAKNTQNLGSIFDPQPSEITGNLHCISNPNEPVIGYISAGEVAQKRIFLDRGSIPTPYIGEPVDCGPTVIEWRTAKNNFFWPASISKGLFIPLDTMTVDESAGNKHLAVTLPECADCTLKGSPKKPAFWK